MREQVGQISKAGGEYVAFAGLRSERKRLLKKGGLWNSCEEMESSQMRGRKEEKAMLSGRKEGRGPPPPGGGLERGRRGR